MAEWRRSNLGQSRTISRHGGVDEDGLVLDEEDTRHLRESGGGADLRIMGGYRVVWEAVEGAGVGCGCVGCGCGREREREAGAGSCGDKTTSSADPSTRSPAARSAMRTCSQLWRCEGGRFTARQGEAGRIAAPSPRRRAPRLYRSRPEEVRAGRMEETGRCGVGHDWARAYGREAGKRASR